MPPSDAARQPPPILALSPGDLAPSQGRRLVETVARCAETGLRGVILRERGLGDREYVELALVLRALLSRARGGWLCLHDRPHLARAVDADAVHLGGRSLAPGDVRGWLDPHVALGLSTHQGDDPAGWALADYAVHGPVCATRKAGATVAGIGFDALARACAATSVPLWALGGLQPAHAGEARRAGARGLAVLSGVLAHPDAAARAAEYVAAWDATASEARAVP